MGKGALRRGGSERGGWARACTVSTSSRKPATFGSHAVRHSRPWSSAAHSENWARLPEKAATLAFARFFHHSPTNHSI